MHIWISRFWKRSTMSKTIFRSTVIEEGGLFVQTSDMLKWVYKEMVRSTTICKQCAPVSEVECKSYLSRLRLGRAYICLKNQCFPSYTLSLFPKAEFGQIRFIYIFTNDDEADFLKLWHQFVGECQFEKNIWSWHHNKADTKLYKVIIIILKFNDSKYAYSINFYLGPNMWI